MKNILTALLGGFFAILIYTHFFEKEEVRIIKEEPISLQRVGFNALSDLPDFRNSVKKSIDAVVHIRTEYKNNSNSLYDILFNDQIPSPLKAEGSGVIISADGYIVTNYHVIKNSSYIHIIMTDKRTYRAKIIGLDPTTDLALLKINEKDLPYAEFGNSDKLEIGDWVLAIGNPYSLGSTVTAGIISAKSRSINIIDKRSAVEAFLQTDAAVNPGNSGGALVNVHGELIGINTAIASRTGSYIGYSFAVPINIVKKVSADLREFGKVQRAVLGIETNEIDAEFAKEEGITKIEGIYISEVEKKSAADKAGLLVKDIIIAFESVNLNSTNELYEQLARYRPGDEVNLKVKRNGKLIDIKATLTNFQGKMPSQNTTYIEQLGAQYQELTDEEKEDLDIKNGIKILTLNAGKLLSADAKEGFIILKINRVAINTIEDIEAVLKISKATVFIEGIYADGTKSYYAFALH